VLAANGSPAVDEEGGPASGADHDSVAMIEYVLRQWIATPLS